MAKRKRSQIDFRDDAAIHREFIRPDTAQNDRSIDEYTVGWICALQEEYDSSCRMLDEEFDGVEVDDADDNSYTFGRVGPHYVVVGCLPAGVYGTNSAARVARDMVRSFPRLRFALLVGIAGGLPTAEHDVRLGDVIVSMPHGSFGGVVQYDLGKYLPGGYFQRTGYLNAPPDKLLGVLPVLRRRYNDPKQPDRIAEHIHRMDDMPDYRKPLTDCLYHADYPHQGGRNCSLCDPKYLVPRADRSGRLITVHYGTIASGNSLVKDTAMRDEIACSEMKPLCFEMEAAGLMNSLPCLVIRGICDYADSHKNDIFHKYAALAAAAYARELLLTLKQSKVVALPSWVEDVKISLSSISNDVDIVKSCISDESLRRWLSPVDPSRSFNTATDSLMPGTGTWLLNKTSYREWKDQPGSIWLHGAPGSGKTVLTSLVINDCLGKLTNASNALLYFYFDFADPEKLTQEAMLRSILWQLAITDEADRSPLTDLYKSCSNGQKQPSRQQMHEVFQQMADKKSDIFLVIDAIDECTDREQLLWSIRYLTMGTKIDLHLCVSSRREKDIEECLQVIVGRNACIGLEKDLVNQDIHHYVRERLDLDKRLGRWKKRADIQKDIEGTIVRHADGMFLLAACQLDSVRECLDLPMLRQTLARLPKTLEGYYSRILSGIIDSNRLYAIKILQWLVYAVRPVKLEEIIDVLAVQLDGDPVFDPRNRLVDPQDIWSICSTLIKIEDFQETKLVRLSHMTVRDYLTSDHARTILMDAMEEVKANTVIAATCLRYVLHLEQHSTESCLSVEFPLASYAAQEWPAHAQVANDEPQDLRPLLEDLFLREKAFSKWAQLFRVPLPEWQPRRAFGWERYSASIIDSPKLLPHIEPLLTVGRKRFSTTTNHSPLFYACFIGLAPAVSLLLERGVDPNVYCDAYGGSPLEIASHLGHEGVARELLAKRAKPNRCGSHRGTALQRAVFGGYEAIIHILLAAGANPNLTPSGHATPLEAALSIGHEHIAILLLDHAADPDTHCGKYGSALNVALMLDSAAVMHHLLEKGANPNLNTGRYGTALQIAAERGNVQAVRALLSKGARPSVYNTKFDSPLGQALYHSHGDILDLLLKAGAYLQPRECGRALELAAYVGNQPMVRALLDNGLDVGLSCRGNYETALWMAASQGHAGIVRLLLAKVPARGITDQFLGLARQWAAKRRHSDIVLLLESGARW